MVTTHSRPLHDRLREELESVKTDLTLAGEWMTTGGHAMVILTSDIALRKLVQENACTNRIWPWGWEPNNPVYQWAEDDGMTCVGRFCDVAVFVRPDFERAAFAIMYKRETQAVVLVDEGGWN